MIISKSIKYYQTKALINKAENVNVAFRIQLYNDTLIDEMVEQYEEENILTPPPTSHIYADLLALNKPQIYKQYQKIIDSKYTSNDAIDNMLIKAKANNDLENVAQAELKRISQNITYIDNILRNYEIPLKEYQTFVKNQEKNALSNRKQIMEQIVKNNGDIIAGGKQYKYLQVQAMAESLMRQSKMTAEYNQITAINNNYINEGKDPQYTHKIWIHTHGGKTTRHTSNHNQKRAVDEKFIVVNDKTLHVDEMMYPCDPRGSPSNAFICYCEVEYKGGEYEPDKDTPRLYPTYPKPKPLPSLPKNLPAGFKKPEGKYINTKYLSATPNVKSVILQNGKEVFQHDYYVTKENGLVYENGVATYNGLVVKNYDPELDWGTISLEEIQNHNKQFLYEIEQESHAEIIDTTNLWEQGEYYLIDSGEGLYKNIETGEWEYNGLVADKYYNGNGYFSKEAVEEHNAKLKSLEEQNNNPPGDNNNIIQDNVNDKITEETEPEIKKLFIKTDDLKGGKDYKGDWYVQESDGVIEVNGKYYYHGLEVKDYDPSFKVGSLSEDVINQHNDLVSDELVKQHISYDDKQKMTYDEDIGGYVITAYDGLDIVEQDGEYYFKGLKINGYDANNKTGFITNQEIIDHNESKWQDLHADTETTEDEPTITKKPIDTSILDELDSESWYINATDSKIKPDIEYDPETKYWYYNGLKIEGTHESSSGTGWINKDDVIEHNKQFTDDTDGNVDAPDKHKIDTNKLSFTEEENGYYVDSYYDDFKLVDGVAYYQGLEIKNYDIDYDEGYITETEIKQHNNGVDEDFKTTPDNKIVSTEDLIKDNGNYLVPKSLIYTVDGKYYYKGFEVKEHPNDNINNYFVLDGAIIDNHNKQFETTSDVGFIDVSNLTHVKNSQVDGYAIWASDLDEIDGKYYYHGLEVDFDDTTQVGLLSAEKVEEHNKQFETTTDANKNNGFLDINELEPALIPGEYKLPKDFDTTNIDTVGSEYDSDGNVVEITTKEAIDEYNKQFTNDDDPGTVKKEFIDTSSFVYSATQKKYYVDEVDGVKYNDADGKYYLNGLEVKDFDGLSGSLTKESVEEHNKQFTDTAKEDVVIKKEYINTNDLEEHDGGIYWVEPDDPHLVYDENTNKVYYKGLVVEGATKDNMGGMIQYENIVQHNHEVGIPQYPIDINDMKPVNVSTPLGDFKIKDKNLLTFDEAGNAYYNGLKAKYYFEDSGTAYFLEEDIIAHNKLLENQSHDTPVSDSNITKEYIDLSNVTKLNSSHGEYGVLDKDIYVDENTGKAYYKGMELKSYDDIIGIGYFDGEDAIKHNQEIEGNNQDTADKPITTNEPGITDFSDNYYHVDCNVADVNYNNETGKWEYHGLELKYYNKNKHEGKLNKKEVEAYNQQIGDNVNQNQDNNKQYISKAKLPQDNDGDYAIDLISNPSLIDDIKFNEDTQQWEYKGLKIHGGDFDGYKELNGAEIGWLDAGELEEHNNSIPNPPTSVEDNNYDGEFITGTTLKYNNGMFQTPLINVDKDENGNYYYKGLKVDSVDENFAYLSPKSVYEHNNQFGLKESLISAKDMKNFTKDNDIDGWVVKSTDNIELTKINGKYYYKGLEVKGYTDNSPQGVITKYDIKQHNAKLKAIFKEQGIEKINTDSHFINYYPDEDAYIIDNDGSNADDFTTKNGKKYYKGLELDKYIGSATLGEGKVSKAKIDEHNELFGIKPNPQHISTDTSSKMEILNHPKYIDTSDLEIKDGNYLFDGDKLTVTLDENQDFTYKGLTLHYAGNGKYSASINDVEEHNKNLKPYSEWVTNTDDIIDIDNMPKDSDGDIIIDTSLYPEQKEYIKYNHKTQQWEYNGVKIEGNFSSPEDKGYLQTEKVLKHNELMSTDPNEAMQKEVINTHILDDYDDKKWFINDDDPNIKDDLKFNPDTKTWFYKGLEVQSSDETDPSGFISKKDVKEHNKSLQSGDEIQLGNKYIDSANSIKVIEENDETYIVDKKTGKKYVYDENETYEKRQDREQYKVDFTENEKDSTEHWGDYGHQYINGLLYQVKKGSYDYTVFGDAMEKLIPLYDKSLELEIKYHNGKISDADYWRTKNKIMEKMEKIIDRVDDPNFESGLNVETIKKVMWEIMDIDTAYVKSPELLQDTFFVRFGHFNDEWQEVGKIIEYEGFTSTTYESGSASHFEDKMRDNPNKWAILVIAPEGTTGARLNRQFHALTDEREWCLARKQRFEVVELINDGDKRVAVIRLLHEGVLYE